MNIRKNGRPSPPKKQILSPVAQRVLHIGLLLIYTSLFRLLIEVQVAAPFPTGIAAYYGEMLEYPLAALMLLTGTVLLFDRAEKSMS